MQFSPLLYQTDSYLREFKATVLACDEAGRALLLDRSAFYPGGGGQPADSGFLTWQGQVCPLERARKTSEGLLHSLAPGGPAGPRRRPGERRPRLATPLPTDAHPHCHAHPVRGGFP